MRRTIRGAAGLILAISAIGALPGAGCAPRRVEYQNLSGAPWLRSGERAREFYRFDAARVEGGEGVDWRGTLGYYVNSSDIAQQCEGFLKRAGAWEEPRLMEKPPAPVFPPSAPTPPDRFYGVGRTITIIAIDPVVAVISSGSTQWTERGVLAWDRRMQGATQEWRTALRHGFRSGSRLPWSEDVQWFSPTTGEGPTAPERVSENERRIAVFWGWITLRREGDEWVVEARRELRE